MTLGLVDLGAVTDLVPTAYTGFAYAARKTSLMLLDDGLASTGNVVVQEASKGYREASLSVVCETGADKDLLRGYEEDSTTVAFVDDEGVTRPVLLLTFTAAQADGDLWTVTVTMYELVAPDTGS